MKSKDANRPHRLSLPKSRFTQRLIRENGLDRSGLHGWVFCAGMQFNSPHKWWGDHGRRDYPHEGLDFCLYRRSNGGIGRLDANTRIPAIRGGRVVAVFKDYLGQAVVVEHLLAANDGRLLTFYAHTRPLDGLKIGARIEEGQVIATLADTRGSRAGIRPHLHFSLGLTTGSIAYEGFEWNTIRSAGVTLLDPLPVLDRPHEVLPFEDSVCRAL